MCGADGQTYGNACIAKCINQKVASQGICQACADTSKGGKPPFCEGSEPPFTPKLLASSQGEPVILKRCLEGYRDHECVG